MCDTEVTLGRFRNDTTVAEDLQQVVFKFPEFNKLLSRECLFSYENSDIESGSRGRFPLPIIMFIKNIFNRTARLFFNSRITLIGRFYSYIYFIDE